MNSNFIDHIRIFCASGAGGNGSAHLRRAKYNPKGGPDGGDGGRGGDVIIRSDSRLWTLIHLKYTRNIRAEDGKNGSRNTRNGKSGANVYVDVPVGTVIKDSETGKVLFELDRNGEERILCKGGQGGLGNDNFKSPTNRTPREFTLRPLKKKLELKDRENRVFEHDSTFFTFRLNNRFSESYFYR